MPSTTYIDELLRQELAASAEIASQVGSRIYTVQAPQGTAWPCLVVARNTQGGEAFADMLGNSGLTRAMYMVSALSDSLEEVRNLARAVRALLQYKQTEGIRLIVVTDEDEQQEESPGGEQLPLYRTDLTIQVTYTAT
jgi:hypothetical protein